MTFRVLLSYHYFRQANLDKLLPRWFPDGVEVFADSGAYSAMSQGAQITVDEYAQWIEKWRHLFAVYANLDEIGDGDTSAVGTARNQKILEDRGLNPLPVFHAAEPWSAFEDMLAAGYGYIALGGLVGRRAPDVMAWMIRCFKLAHGQAVFHGFGMTQWDAISALPFYSVDSSSWGTGYRYRIVKLFDEDRGRIFSVQMNHKGIYGNDGRAAKIIRSYGFDPADYADPARYTRAGTCALCVVSYHRAEKWLRKRFGPVVLPEGRRLPERNGPIDPTTIDGVRSYFADTGVPNLVDAGEGLRSYWASTSTPSLQDAGHGLHLYLAENDTVNLNTIGKPLEVTTP